MPPIAVSFLLLLAAIMAIPILRLQLARHRADGMREEPLSFRESLRPSSYSKSGRRLLPLLWLCYLLYLLAGLSILGPLMQRITGQ